ncbi:MAG: ABC transporter ATP-binding protein/permease [Gammaproteobacteria bacterium]|nr:ABC transporter ATP-binding protein/permease [Gammaproteobacteria bacterium]
MKRLSHLLRETWWLTKPYFTSEDRWAGLGLLVVLIGLNLGSVYLQVLFTEWNNLFYTALQDKNWDVFIHQMFRFSWIAALFIAAAVYQIYLNQMLQIRWRKWLTRRYLDSWLDRRAYYRMQLGGGTTDNPDQRISDDLRLFVGQTLSLSLGLLSAVVTLISFLGMLWFLSGAFSFTMFGHAIRIPGYMVWFALGYAVLGTWLTNLVGRKLILLNFNQQRFEADFRFSLIRVRENADAIALDAGEASEKRGLLARFTSVVDNWWGIMKAQKQLTWLTSGYGQIAIIFPFLVASPGYFSGKFTLGILMQTASAFGQVQSSLSYIVSAYTDLASWAAVVDRLSQFRATTDSANQTTGGLVVEHGDQPTVSLDDLAIDLPGAAPLLAAPHLDFTAGHSALITGPSGSGKSTLFRAIAGIWPFGSGTVRLPAGARIMFLPQRPYLPVGRLRDVLTYPQTADTANDERLREVLRLCLLPDLESRLDEERHWGLTLSPGEQQRVAFARVFLQKPDWLFVDEATAQLDEDTERELYTRLAHELPRTTVISIGHRSTLRAFHTDHVAIEKQPGAARAQVVRDTVAAGMAAANGLPA